MTRFIPLCFVAVLISGCLDEETRDVSYYLDHRDEMRSKLAECQNNPGEKDLTPNCVNARKAEMQAMVSSQNMPSIK